MKRETIITTCLCSFLLGLGCHTYRQATAPPMPKPPKFTAAQRAMVSSMAAVVPPPSHRDLPAWKLPNTNLVYRLYDTQGRYLGEGGGVVAIPMTNSHRFFYLRAELTRDEWLRGLPKL